MNRISLTEKIDSIAQKDGENPLFITEYFYRDGKPLSQRAPVWGMTLREAGSMRFRWNEKNLHREKMLATICGKKEALSLELIHSKIVLDIKKPGENKNQLADGMITTNKDFVPVVTVADCVPIFLFCPETGVFAALHSGWRGTGIAAEAIKKACEIYGGRPEDFCAAIGPHIHKCCYSIDGERAKYFIENFGSDCVEKSEAPENSRFPYRLSLARANENLLLDIGIKEENIIVCNDCTCSQKNKAGTFPFGSFRREAAFLPPEVDAESRSRSMTVQAAFCGYL